MEMEGITRSVKDYWQSFDLDGWLAEVGITYSLPVQAALCFGSGFAIGFLFKKYFKFFVGTLIASLILIKFLEYNHILVVDWQGLRAFMGFSPTSSVNAMINESFDWIKDNIVIFLASVIGFLLGCKLG